MKRFLSQGGRRAATLLTLLLSIAIISPAIAADYQKNLTFAWEQATADLPGLDKWKLYVSPASGGQAVAVIEVPYAGGSGPGFTSQQGFTVSGFPGATVRRYFVLTAVAKTGQETLPSNEVFFDFIIPWADVTTPINLTVTVTVLPQ